MVERKKESREKLKESRKQEGGPYRHFKKLIIYLVDENINTDSKALERVQLVKAFDGFRELISMEVEVIFEHCESESVLADRIIKYAPDVCEIQNYLKCNTFKIFFCV